MKGLLAIPQKLALEKVYDKLLHQDASIRELALYSQWTRFDPRLGEIWISYVGSHWKDISAIQLREELFRQPWPSAAGVLLEFTKNKVEKIDLKLFEKWLQLVMHGVLQAPWQQYFIGLRAFGGTEMFDDAVYSLSQYRKWGYLSREVLLPKSHRSIKKSMNSETREEVLRGLLGKNSRIQTEAYWVAIGKCVSRRQAERDLRKSRLVRTFGQTKGRYFVRRGE